MVRVKKMIAYLKEHICSVMAIILGFIALIRTF